MADKVWKAFERTVAKFFDSTRTPLSGGNGKQTRSDSLHPQLYVECKYSAKSALYSLYQETVVKAVLEDKIPIICTKKKGMDGFLITVHSRDFESVCELTRKDASDSESLQGLSGLRPGEGSM
jgi:hypothetical protein